MTDQPDDDDRDYYDSLPEEDDDNNEYFDCGMDRNGNCCKAGSEECDWECPYLRVGDDSGR